MALITRKTKPRADYHQWSASELSNGDILGILESLGRAACSVTIESIGSASTIRFNVIKKIRKTQRFDNGWMQDAEFWTKPGVIDEIELEKDDIVVEADSTQTWTDREICVSDIKIVTKGTGLKITVT